MDRRAFLGALAGRSWRRSRASGGLGVPLMVLTSPYNQTALLNRGARLFRKRIVVVDVPFHLK
jgi:hypothetical protein